MGDPWVIGLRLVDGLVQPLAWSPRKLSKKELRRAIKKFRKDADVVEAYCGSWSRLYQTQKEMKSALPEF